MADKIMIGRSAVSVDHSPAFSPYTNVIVTVSSDTWYEASGGSNAGRTLEVTCPWGTQAMANNILRQIRGYTYRPVSASGAILNPAAAMGDAVTVDGVYSVISERKIKFGGLMSSDISAPADEEIDHEYPYLNAKDRQVKREISKNASAVLTVTTDKIEAEVKRATAAEGELSGRLTVAADSIAAEITRAKSAEQTLSSSITMTESSILATVSSTYATKSSVSNFVTAASISADLNGISLSYTKSSGATTTGSKLSIRDQITLESSKDITITGNHLIVTSDNFSITKAGAVSITGKFTTSGGRYTCELNGFSLRFLVNGTESGYIGMATDDSVLFRMDSGKYISLDTGYGSNGIYIGYSSLSYNLFVDGGLRVNTGTLYSAQGQSFYNGTTVNNTMTVYGESTFNNKIKFGNGNSIWYYGNGGIFVDCTFYANGFQTNNNGSISGYNISSSGSISSSGAISGRTLTTTSTITASSTIKGSTLTSGSRIDVGADQSGGGGYFNGLTGGGIATGGRFYAQGDMWCSGTKSRAVDTKDYGTILLYAMESATPMFSDTGSGVLDENGIAYIFFDPDFSETVELRHEYQVFLTQTGVGAVRYAEKHKEYFVVYGDPGATFDWIVYCRQRDYESIRLESPDTNIPIEPEYDFIESDDYQPQESIDYVEQEYHIIPDPEERKPEIIKVKKPE